MSSPDATTAAAAELTEPELVAVGSYATFGAAAERGLVVLAMGEAYWLVPEGNAFRLLVPPAIAADVTAQLARYERESAGWPPPRHEEPPTETVIVAPLVWLLAVGAAFRAQAEWPALTARGALDAAAVFDRGEVWRAATALFLHGDLAHLVSNGLSGVLVFAAVLTTLGRARGAALIAASAVAGNLAVAALAYPGPYVSIGASTAVFAGIGLLAGRALRVTRSNPARRWQRALGPVGAGLTLLGLYGAGGLRVDVMAHATGFAAGLALGFVFARLRVTATGAAA